MFRKIHSNRDPGDTLFSEIKKEFGKYFDNARNWFSGWTLRYPKFLFGAMVFSILLSLCLSFTLFRPRPPVKKKPPGRNVFPVSDGLGQIMQLGSALQEAISIKKQVDSLIAKKELTKQDSLTLEKDLDSLQHINIIFKVKP